nr:unnamed protein product [Callosobruchus chinensis]
MQGRTASESAAAWNCRSSRCWGTGNDRRQFILVQLATQCETFGINGTKVPILSVCLTRCRCLSSKCSDTDRGPWKSALPQETTPV